MKRKLCETADMETQNTEKQFNYKPMTVLSKRKACDDCATGAKRRRQENVEAELLRKNRELEEMVQALLHKVSALEYMLQMFRQNETIGSNRLVQAY